MGKAFEEKQKSRLSDTERVQDFQRKLYHKAKRELKSQKVSKLYRRYGFEGIVNRFGMIDPSRYIYQK